MLSLSLFPLNTYKYMQVKLITSYHSHAFLKVSFKLHLKLLYHVDCSCCKYARESKKTPILNARLDM